MDIDAQSITVLEALGANDEELAKAKREFDALPQRAAIVALRKKLEDMVAKLETVSSLEAQAQKKLEELEADDKRIAAKIESANKVLQNAEGRNFRDVQARSKELEGLVKQRKVLTTNHDAASNEMLEILTTKQKLEALITKLRADEAREVASFKEQGTALKRKIVFMEAQHKDFLAELPREVSTLYERAYLCSYGIALATLSGDRCSVCRCEIDRAHLSQLHRDAPLGTCPGCRRLMLVNQ